VIAPLLWLYWQRLIYIDDSFCYKSAGAFSVPALLLILFTLPARIRCSVKANITLHFCAVVNEGRCGRNSQVQSAGQIIRTC
jgi:hypothetical protein